MDISEKDTKILCTIGPATVDKKILKKLYTAGMNAIRINTAHGDFPWYEEIIKNTKSIADLPIIIDIKGPELRIKSNEKYKFNKKNIITIGFNKKNPIYLNYNILSNLKKGDVILIEDGKYKLIITKILKDTINAISDETCIIEPNKNVHIPNKKIPLPSLTKKDIKAIKFSIKNNIDYIALSYCRNKKDVMNLRRKLGNSNIKIIAKIENKEGVENIEEIIQYSDGVMVARGDLGVELSPEKVPLAQKHIIRMCNEKSKLVIVATQMLESMITSPNPTRAEISDVANAVLDGADCVMLSAETAIGKYPIKAVEFMTKATINVEAAVVPTAEKEDPCTTEKPSISQVIASSVSELCKKLPITKIVCLTYSGHTATQIAKFRIDLPLITVTKSPQIKRQLMLYYAIRSNNMKTNFKDPDSVKILIRLYKEKKLNKDDLVLFTAGLHTLHEKRTNTIQIHRISDIYAYSKKKERENSKKRL